MGIWTPWGLSDSNTALAPGIGSYSTPSSWRYSSGCQSHNKKMPDSIRAEDGWYEETAEWAKVALIFPEAFKPEHVEMAINTLKNWLPHEYEGCHRYQSQPGRIPCAPGRNLERTTTKTTCRLFPLQGHAVGLKLPEGMVGVEACIGGRNKDGNYAGKLRYFLVPESEYKQPFVIEDEKKYEEVSSDFTRIAIEATK